MMMTHGRSSSRRHAASTLRSALRASRFISWYFAVAACALLSSPEAPLHGGLHLKSWGAFGAEEAAQHPRAHAPNVHAQRGGSGEVLEVLTGLGVEVHAAQVPEAHLVPLHLKRCRVRAEGAQA